MKIRFFLFLALVFFNFVFSQNTTDVLNQAKNFSNRGRYISSNKLLHTFLEKKQEELSKEDVINVVYELYNNHHASTSDSTSYYLNILKKIQDTYKIKSYDEKVLYAEGLNSLKDKKYDFAMQKMVLCNEKAINNKNIEYQVKSNKVMGLLFFMNKNYPKAKEYYNKSIQIDKNEDHFDVKVLLVNCLLSEKKLDSTWIILEQIKNKAYTKNDSIQLFANYTKYYLYKSNPLTSLSYAHKAKELLAKQEVEGELKSFNQNLKNKKSITEKLDKLLEIGKYEISKEAILETQKISADINNDSLKENEMLQKMLNYKDSVFLQNQNEIITEIETKYQTKNKEKENLQLKSNIKFLALIIFGISILAIVIYLFYKKTKKQKELTESQKNEIEKQKQTIENLQKFLHHENKNNLSRISAFIDVAKEETIDQKIISKLNETQGRLQSIYEVHSQLYLSENLSNINFKNYIDKLAKSVQHTHDKKQVEIINNISENLKVSTEIVFSLGLIVNEFITNSFKHAFSSINNPEICIDLKQVNNKYVLEFSDNGNGLFQNFDIKNLNSYGFELVKILTKELNGSLKMENKNGLQINIEF